MEIELYFLPILVITSMAGLVVLIFSVSSVMESAYVGSLLQYDGLYNKRKRRFYEERKKMQKDFESEILKTQSEVREQILETIASDLHDNIGQLLSLISLTLHTIDPTDPDKVKEKIETTKSINSQALKEMRALGKLIQADQLVQIGLIQAIKGHLNWIEKSGRYKIAFLIPGNLPDDRNSNKDLFLFRMTQEILNNIIKHSEAQEIAVKIEYNEPVLELEISDNGIGFNVGNTLNEPIGMGLKNIQKRVEILGGKYFIKSQNGMGTTITILISYP